MVNASRPPASRLETQNCECSLLVHSRKFAFWANDICCAVSAKRLEIPLRLGGRDQMRIVSWMAVGLMACALNVGSPIMVQTPAMAQGETLAQQLDAAITKGDVATINALIAANKGDATATAQIATIL